MENPLPFTKSQTHQKKKSTNKKKMIKFLLVLFFIAAAVSFSPGIVKKSAQVPQPSNGRLPIGTPFTAFNGTLQTVFGSYTEYQTTYNSAGVSPYEAVFLPGEAYYFNQGPGLGGVQWTLPNGTYFYFDMPGEFVACWYSFTGTYNYQMDVFKTIVKIGEQGIFDWYLGFANDFGACGMGATLRMAYQSL